MDDKKTRKVGLEAFIGDEAKEAGAAIAKATRGHDNMMRVHEKAMRAATRGLDFGSAYRAACGSFNSAAYYAAFGSMHDAAYSEARRVAEMTCAALVPNFAHQANEISDAARQISELVTGAAAFREWDLGMQACRDAIEATIGPTKYIETSLTRDLVANFEALQKSFDLGPAVDAAALQRSDHLQESVRAALTPLESTRIELPITSLTSPVRQEPHNPTAQFMASFRRQLDEALKQAEEEGGKVVVYFAIATGDPISVSQVTPLDENFVLIEGIDFNKRLRKFRANSGGLNLAFEVVSIDEDPEEGGDDDSDQFLN